MASVRDGAGAHGLAAFFGYVRAAFSRRRIPRSIGKESVGRRTVWILDQYAVPPSMTGFTRQYEHGRLLRELGWDPLVVASPYDHKRHIFERPVSLLHPKHEIDEDGVRFLWIYSLPYVANDWRRYANMTSFLISCVAACAFRRPPSVILASSPHLLTGLAGVMLAKWHRVPLVAEIRDLWPDSLTDMGLSNPLIIRPLAWVERRLYRNAAHVVVLAEGGRAGVRAKGVPEHRVTLIPNAVMASQSSKRPDGRELRDRLGWGDKTVFIYAGAHGAANALNEVVAAAERLSDRPDIMIALLGDGPEKPALRAAAKHLGNVVFLDAVPKEAVSTWIAAADVGLITLRKSQVFQGVRPNKLFDYLAAGLPIVTTVPGETAEMVVTAGAGLSAAPGDIDGLKQAILLVADDHALRRQMAQNARELHARTPSREDAARKLSEVLTASAFADNAREER